MDFSLRSSSPRRKRRDAAVSYIVLAATLAIYVLQLRSLYTVPIPDSVRWGGDETWLMREFGNQARHGVMAYPENFGEPQRTDGVLAGSMWVNALIYGVPGILFSPSTDLVTIGRSVTAILGLLLIVGLFIVARRLGVHPIIAAGVVAVMTISQGFATVTHCARYDTLTGIVLLWFLYVLSKFTSGSYSARAYFLLAFCDVALIAFSRHLLTLPLAATIAWIIIMQLWQHPKLFRAWCFGALSSAALLALAYWLGSEEFSLFGRGGQLGSFSFVLRQIPIMRPFSRNVQLSNLHERFDLFSKDASGVLLIVFTAIALIALYKVWQLRMQREGKQLRIARTREQSFFLIATALSLVSWLLLQGTRPYYLFHVVPILCVACAIVLELFSDVHETRWFGLAVPSILIIIAVALQANRAIPATTFGVAVARDQAAAIPRLLSNATGTTKPRVLVDVAGLDRALQDSTHEILTLDMFQPPPIADALVKKLRANRIDFVILRSSPIGEAFEPGRALLPLVLDSIGEPRDTALGFFYDDGRNYDASLTTLIDQGLDTLKLYEILK